ncbi:hypothetical protein GJAV_G00093610 [Gymnothorax javanicus]|nr:hypothetical protein GJAV_G00093610 [Gymnothorax javanicus]
MEEILFGPPSSISGLASGLGPLAANLHPVVKNLGFWLDSSLNLNKQLSSVFDAVGGAVKHGADAPIVEKLNERKSVKHRDGKQGITLDFL